MLGRTHSCGTVPTELRSCFQRCNFHSVFHILCSPSSLVNVHARAACRQLSSRLPRFDRCNPSQPITTSAALVIARGMPGTPAAAAATSRSGSDAGPLPAYTDSCWCSPNCPWASMSSGCDSAAVLGYNAAGSSSASASWQQALCSSVVSTWPSFAGSVADVHLGASPIMVAGFGSSAGELGAA
jgi:hypothetical protein